MKKIMLTLASALTISSTFADTVKIGYVTTLTTPQAEVGEDMKKGAELALEHLGGKAGSTNLEIIFADDAFKPETGKQVSDRLVKQNKVDFVTGFIWSHVLLASQKTVLDSGKFLISANAGPSDMAGKLCHKNFFAIAAQNDQTPMATGEVFNKMGIKKAYVLAPNFKAGIDMLNGFERTYKGEIVGKSLTKWGADQQLDFSTELAKIRASGAEALYIFYPGPAGTTFLSQYDQAGLTGKVKIFSVYTIDAIALPSLQKANMPGILDSYMVQEWDQTLDNPTNKKFVSDFKKKHGYYPSYYGALSYDTIMLIASAVKKLNGDVSDQDKVRAALRAADFNSTRNNFKYGTNHFPVQNFYLRQVVKDSDGVWTTKVIDLVYKDHVDPYASVCKMK